MIKLKDLILETWNSNIWPSNIWNSDIWKSSIWNSNIWNPDGGSHSFSNSNIGDVNGNIEETSEDKIKNKNPRLGLCYELSGRYVSTHPNSILVHGRLVNPFKQGHVELDHAWIENGNEILDPVMDKIWSKDVYESLFNVKIYKKYY